MNKENELDDLMTAYRAWAKREDEDVSPQAMRAFRAGALSPKPDRPMLSDERSDSVRALGKAHDVLHNCRTMLPQSDGAHAEIEQAMAGIRWVLNCIRADREGQS